MIVFRHGEFLPSDHPSVRVFLPGTSACSGVFTTLPLIRAHAPDLDLHRARLERHAAALNLAGIPPAFDLPAIFIKLAEANDLANQHARLRLTLADDKGQLLFLAAADPMPDLWQDQARDGTHVITVDETFARTDRPHLKTLAMGPSLAALEKARRAEATEAFVITGKEHLTEGAISNIFLLKEGRWVTPVADGRLLAGLMRNWILENALPRRNTLGGGEEILTRQDLQKAREVFYCNALRGIVPVVRIDGQAVGNGHVGPATRRLQDQIRTGPVSNGTRSEQDQPSRQKRGPCF